MRIAIGLSVVFALSFISSHLVKAGFVETVEISSPAFLLPFIKDISSYLDQLTFSYLISLLSFQTSWLLLLSLIALRLYYIYFWRPLEYSKDLRIESAGRNTANFPPPYPIGWFKVAISSDVKIGDVKELKVLGQELVLFRSAGTKDGKNRGNVYILDGYCPHLGAHLGVGGTVQGDCIQCPFHGWQFNGDGKCASIPYCSPVPEFAKTRSWPVREVNGIIIMWHDPEGGEPTWEPIRFPDFHKMWYQGKTQHIVSCHIQEIPENGTDFQHFHFLHTPFVLKCLWMVKHVWKATWVQSPAPNGHLADMTVCSEISMWGFKLPISFNVVITQIGPGLVHLNIILPMGNVLIVETVTPIGPLLQNTSHICYASRFVPRFIAKLAFKAMLTQYERDVPIWANKLLLRKPMILKEDGQVTAFRRYFKQFYSKEGTKKREELSW